MARTDITEPIFIVQDLIIEGSTNFTFGEKGKGKTEFILGLINGRDELTLPQCKYLSRKDLTIADIEEVFTLDNYNNDVKNFSTKYNLDLEIGHLNQSNRERFDTLLQFINENDDIKNNLIEIYKEDIELYNSQTKKK